MARAISLRVKVPLFIGTGVLIVLAVWTWISYVNVRAAMIVTGEQRLATVTPEVARLLQGQLRQFTNQLRAVATRNTAIQDFVQSAGKAQRDSTTTLMKRMAIGENRRVTLFSLDGTPLITATDSTITDAPERHEDLAGVFARALAAPDSTSGGPLRKLDGRSVFPLVARVVARDSTPVGFLVLWRGLAATQATNDQLAGLIGTDARVFWGNSRGDLWAHLDGTEKVFPTAMRTDGKAIAYARENGTRVIATASPILGTPWLTAISFPDSALMAPAHAFLTQSIYVGFGVAALAIALAWFLSRRITTPLHRLTEAAAAVASGDHATVVAGDRSDELGVLAESFNQMVARVNASHAELERKVADRTELLQDRNEELEAFAHSVSHDLRAPLRAMHGFSQALLEDCGGQLGEVGTDYARRIAEAARRMDSLTTDLLAYSKVSRTEMPLVPVDLNAVAGDAVAQLEADVTSRAARVDVETGMPRVLAHRPVLEQVIANLVANGLKFVRPAQSPRVTVRAERNNGAVRLWVSDNGIGIDPAHHHRIFSVFERLHDVAEYSGTGIGLAIVRKGIERMGGKVGVESALGSGSKFWIELQPAETQ